MAAFKLFETGRSAIHARKARLFWGGGSGLGSLFSNNRNASVIVVAVLAVAAAGYFLWSRDGHKPKVIAAGDTEVSSQAKRASRFQPTPAQWASLGMEPV